uniref:BTB domain-containing protein n=1 Tax=Strongyloides stercoralis TaxID=6248 RepID=A0A0K0E9X0_STRER
MSLVLKKPKTVFYNLPPEKNNYDNNYDKEDRIDNKTENFIKEKIISSDSDTDNDFVSNKVIFYVKNRTFVLDKDFLINVSPLFKIIINSSNTINSKYGIKKDIVDEKPIDIDIFLKCLQDSKNISYDNVALIMRLSTKYVVPSLIENCSNFIKNIDIKNTSLPVIVDIIKNCLKSMPFDKRFEKLILRIAMEDSIKIQALKLTHINHKLYGSVMATHFNILYMKAVENMNGHFFNLEKNKLKYIKNICKNCNMITDIVFCVGCKKELCEKHWREKCCENNYGLMELYKIKENLVDISKD